jgi:hypothetical protein
MKLFQILLATFFISSLFGFTVSSTASAKPIAVGKTSQKTKIKYKPFAARGPAKTGAVGGKRGCAIAQGSETKKGIPYGLVPREGIGRTISTQPVVWIYSPYQIQTPLNATLVVRQIADNGKEKQVGEEISLSIPGNSGLISVSIKQPLQDGMTYKWIMTFECEGDAAANPTVAGFITVDMNTKLQSSLQSVPPRQQMAEYAQQGYWYDILDQLLTSNTDDAKADLQDFLQSGGLETGGNESIHRTAKP